MEARIGKNGFRTLASALALCAAVWLVYAVALRSPFLWDDEVMVVENPRITSFAGSGRIWTLSAFGQPLARDRSYRPLQIFSYVLDYRMWGLSPAGFHATSILIHMTSTLLLYLLVLQFGFSPLAALATAAVFGIHPLNVESVTYVSGRGNVLFLCLTLLGFNAFVFGIKGHPAAFALTLATYPLALLAKENALVAPLLMAGYLGVRHSSGSETGPKEMRAGLGTVGALVLTTAAYLVFRLWLLPDTGGESFSHMGRATVGQRLATIPWILWTGVKLLVLPHPLHMDYLYVSPTWWNWYLLTLFPLAVVAILGLYRWVGDRFWGLYLLGWPLAALAPVLPVFFPLASTFRESWMYLPQIGILLLGVLGFEKWYREATHAGWRRAGALLGVLYVLALGALTVRRNLDWLDPVRLYRHDLAFEPGSYALHNNLGDVLLRQGDYTGALDSFLRSVEASPNKQYGVALYGAGLASEKLNRPEQARVYYQKSIRFYGYQNAYPALAGLELRQGNYREALAVLQAALAASPQSLELNYLLGYAYYRTDRREEAVRVLSAVRARQPGYRDTEYLLGRMAMRRRPER